MKIFPTELRINRLLCVASAALSMIVPALAAAQEVKVWEFSPYQVEVWYAFENNVNLSQFVRTQFAKRLEESLQSSFRAAWKMHLSGLPSEWSALALDRFDEFTVNDLTRNELVLAIASGNPQTRAIRTMEAAIDELTELSISANSLQRLKKSAQAFLSDSESLAMRLLEKCVVDEGGDDAIRDKLESGGMPCAVLPRDALADAPESVRILLTPLPWHTDEILRQRDKVIFLTVGMQGEEYRFHARELDCPMRFLGPSFQSTTIAWSHAARAASTAIIQAFAPVARVEEAEATSARLRHRAGGLIVNPQNPAAIHVGDVFQPIVRRDDRNGIPTLLQPLSWTFAAITSSDGIKMDANVYSYSGGPGLQGRRNRRTQRMLLRVRPNVPETHVRIVVRGSEKPQSGCLVYQKDLMDGEFELLGRTDWRGQFELTVPPSSGQFLPDAVVRQRAAAKREALKRLADDSNPDPGTLEKAGESSPEVDSIGSTSRESDAVTQKTAAEIESEIPVPESDPDAIPLNYPLLQLYLKNGDTVLAKLPIVPGLQRIETAELPDDSRRLETEAFVRGFQGEILDLVGLRNLLAARLTLFLKDGKVEEASDVLGQMQRLPTYNEMTDRLEQIQREMLDEQTGEISLGSKRQIDRMFQSTRTLLQKFLQDGLLTESEAAIKRAKEGV